MSYNGYNQYSPYWQQTAGQTTPQSAGHNVGQSGPSYQSLSAYQNNQKSALPSISRPAETTGASYRTQGYGNVGVNGAGSGRPNDFRAVHTKTNDRASLDGATALGNLAYASTLGRDGSTQQAANYNRQQSNINYGTRSPYGMSPAPIIQNRTSDERRGSNGSSKDDTNARAQQAAASPSFGYSNNAAYQGPSAGGSIQTQTQYSQPRSTSEQLRPNHISQPPRPTSGQAIQQPLSRPDSRAAPSPTTYTTPTNANQSRGKKDGGKIRGMTQTRNQTPQQSSSRPSSSQVPGTQGGHAQRSQAQQGTRETGTKQSANSAAKSKAAPYLFAKETAAKRVSDVQQSPTVDANRQSSKPATPVEPQYTTVDPSQVFNHVEYSRRQAAAAAEAAAAKKAAEEAEAAKTAAMQPKTSATTSAAGVEPDLAKKDQIELEMKQMIEKMRDYKAKDPSLFTQIWEQVKKGQPPQRALSQSHQGSATSPIVVNGQLPSPSLIQNQLPPESDLPASDEFPPNFDRGRFPAQRRRRGGGKRTSTGRKNSGTPNGSTSPAAQIETAEIRGSPVPPEIAIPTPKVGQIFPDPKSQSMQQAMQQFHDNSKSPVAKQQRPGPNGQVTTNNSTHASSVPPSQPVLPQSAPPLKPGGTYWPESKKKSLAEAARTALTSTATNKGKIIITQEIHDLLDTNPSYIQMCEILEYRGFVIDRGQLARILLKAVPDLGSASNSANAASTNSTNANTPTNAAPTVTASTNGATKATSATPTAGSFGMLVKASNDSAAQPKAPRPLPYSAPPAAALQAPNPYVNPYGPTPPSAKQASGGDQNNGIPRDYRFVDPAHWSPDMPRHHAGLPNQVGYEPALHLQNPPFSVYQQPGSTNGQALDQNGAIHSRSANPHPTKQEMARKRTFDEIVDLTQIHSDEEDFERRGPRPRLDYESAPGPSMSVTNTFDQVAWRQQNSDRNTPKPFKYKYSGRDALLQSHDIIEPMNRRRDALRRSMYNPKTISRDILLSIGRHPIMAPLNAHLDVLKDRFKAVDNESDLRTFRWDLVDPDGEASATKIDTDDEDVFPTVNPEPRHLPAPMAVMVSDGGIADNEAKISKRGPYKKRDIRSQIQPIGSAHTPERQSPQSSPYIQDVNTLSGTNSTDLSQFAYDSPYTAQRDLTAFNASTSSTPGSRSKRKGRPPGAKNKQVRPDKGIPKKTKTPSLGATPSTAKAKPLDEETVEKTNPVGSSSSEKRSAPIPTRPHINTTTPSRPSGLRNSMSAMTPTDGIAVVIPSRSPSVVVATPQNSARKGRLNKAEDLSNGTPSDAPAYTMYRCLWENCPAELHNLETLKKHVKKHRRDTDGVYTCLWADCFDGTNPISNNAQDEDRQYQRLKFKTDAEWVTHVESTHLGTERNMSVEVPDSGGIEAKHSSI